MPELTPFQEAAVECIVRNFEKPAGSRRFLLADEVGLGKTLVAQGVISKMMTRNPRRGFTVVYICSNLEIGEQNRTKLISSKKAKLFPGRLSLLPLDSRKIEKERAKGKGLLFSFTPGTSLHFGRSTGISQERRLILYLLSLVWGKRTKRQDWREYFRCSVEKENWQEQTCWRKLHREFGRKISLKFRKTLREEWDKEDNKAIREEWEKEDTLRNAIDKRVKCFRPKSPAFEDGHKRNTIVAALRRGLAQAALRYLKPDLLILDEFQRFKEILNNSRQPNTVEGRLFGKKGSSILILSATPYRMYTQSFEDEDHHEDFMTTLRFLWNADANGAPLAAVKNDLRRFKEKLEGLQWKEAYDPELRGLKSRIEQRLKEVMCRTERNWYIEDAGKGVCEVAADVNVFNLPSRSEFAEYIRLRRLLLHRKIAEWNITDYWKSCPSILSFMMDDYALIRHLRRHPSSIPRELLVPISGLGQVWRNNYKFRTLFSRIFNCGAGLPEKANPAAGWRFLWIRPRYTYYQDDFFGDQNPSKYLIFSHWRFVPRAISILASSLIEEALGKRSNNFLASPLQFRKIISFYPFDVCYPSPLLARTVSQSELARISPSIPPEKLVRKQAGKAIRKLLAQNGIKIGLRQNAPLWQMIARMEGHSTYKNMVRDALENRSVETLHGTSKLFRRHCDRYLNWLEGDESLLVISRAGIERLVDIALYSPAVCLLRSLHSVHGDPDTLSCEMLLCLNELRNYFNRPIVQAVIRRHGHRTKSYTRKVLNYCRDAHFQAVVDEYCYLVSNVLQKSKREESMEHLSRVLGIGSVAFHLNERGPKGRLRTGKGHPAHFALAFGEDATPDSKASQTKGSRGSTGDARSRRSAVREAFNSPFWPFVLATTSVGQEGLDFHLYCRDVVHWNLPSNPVDLEQREGRINRYDSFAVRQNIVRDYPLTDIQRPASGTGNLWKHLFETIGQHPRGIQRFKHGLFPHWIYFPGQCSGIPMSRDDGGEMVRRHTLFHNFSRDASKYQNLKRALSLYRLVFGQPRQQDILESLAKGFSGQDTERLANRLRQYMINLSPFEKGYALKYSRREAHRIIQCPEHLRCLLCDLSRTEKTASSVTKHLPGAIEALARLAAGLAGANRTDHANRTEAIAALLYYINPFDDTFDFLEGVGLKDDLAVLRQAYSAIPRD